MGVYGSAHVCLCKCACVFKLELVHPQDMGVHNHLGCGPCGLLLIQEWLSAPGGLRDLLILQRLT